MDVIQAAPEAPEKPTTRYADPVVQSFYATALEALENAPDGASAATVITGAFQRHHHGWQQSNTALHSDVRRLSADEGVKAAMLTHATGLARRMMDEHLRTVGQLHAHQTVESQLHELARQLDERAAAVAEEIRDILTGITPVAIEAPVRIVLAHTPDPRWSCGWFRRSDRREGPLQPLPFAGWVLVADDHQSAQQGVQAAFLHGGSWLTKTELSDRGMSLERLD